MRSNKVKKTEPRKERGYRLCRDKLLSEYGYLAVRSVVMVVREMKWTLVERQWKQINQSEQRSGPFAERPSSLDLKIVTREYKQRLDSDEAGSEVRGRANRNSREIMGGTFFLQHRHA